MAGGQERCQQEAARSSRWPGVGGRAGAGGQYQAASSGALEIPAWSIPSLPSSSGRSSAGRRRRLQRSPARTFAHLRPPSPPPPSAHRRSLRRSLPVAAGRHRPWLVAAGLRLSPAPPIGTGLLGSPTSASVALHMSAFAPPPQGCAPPSFHLHRRPPTIVLCRPAFASRRHRRRPPQGSAALPPPPASATNTVVARPTVSAQAPLGTQLAVAWVAVAHRSGGRRSGGRRCGGGRSSAAPAQPRFAVRPLQNWRVPGRLACLGVVATAACARGARTAPRAPHEPLAAGGRNIARWTPERRYHEPLAP